MYDGRTNLSADVAAEVRRHLGDRVFDTVIPRSVRLSEAPSHGLPIARYAPDSTRRRGVRGAGRPSCGRRRRRGADGRARGDPDDRDGGRHDRPTRALAGPRPRPRLAHPAAQPGAAAARSRSPIARIRAEPATSRASGSIRASLAVADARASREHGVLQPILVTETLDGYQLVAGERRLRAAQAAGLERIPAVVRQLADREQLELALVENLQREDLDPLETAARLPPADRRVRVQPGRRRRRGSAGPARPSPTRFACSTSRPASRPRSRDGRLTEGHGRALGGLAPSSRTGSSTRSSARTCRSARPRSSSGGCASRGRSRPDRAARRTRSRPRACRGGPAPRARHQGQPRPLAARRPDRHRVLQRRRARATLRAPDRRDRVTEDADQPSRRRRRTAAPRRAQGARPPAADYTAASIQVLEGLEAVRKRPGHVHRLDRRARPAPPRLGGRRQLDRRGDGRPGDHDHVTIRDGRHRHRRRTTAAASRSASTRPARTPSRSSTPSSTPAASSAAAATRSRAACTASASASSTRCRSGCASSRPATASIWAQEYERGKPTTPVKKIGPQGARRGTTTSFLADPEMFETTDYSFDLISQRLRESAYLTKGVWITLIDERDDRERSFYFEGGLQSFVRHLNRNKEVLHTPADLRRATRGRRPRSRSPSSTTTRTRRTSSRSPTTSTRSTAARTSPASARR